MPWVRARLRDSLVFARASADGRPLVENGTVEVRYKPNDGRMYRARAGNLVVADPTPLPDDTCAEAKAVEKPEGAPKPAKRETPTHSPAAIPADAVVVYADGACSGNPGPAGLGVFLTDGREILEISEYLGKATNNIAELTAVLRALERVDDPKRPIVLHTDSQYAIGVLTKGWKAKANAELIAKIREELARRRPHVKLVYVPGHSGVSGNERADQLARRAISERKTRVESVRKELPA